MKEEVLRVVPKCELDFTVWEDEGPMFCPDTSDGRALSRDLASFEDLRDRGICIQIYLDGSEPGMPEGTEAVNVIDWLLDDGVQDTPSA